MQRHDHDGEIGQALKPLVLPASTSLAFFAGAVATILSWALKQWGGVDVPEPIKDAAIVIITVLAGHFTTDSPSAPVAREAVADAAADAEMDAAERKK